MDELILSEMEAEEFAERTDIVKIRIEEGITEIPAGIFMHCTNLKEVILPHSLKRIEDGAFFGCTALSHIVLPQSLETIGEYAFSESGLVEITVPSTVGRIGEMVLYHCEKLTELNILSVNTQVGKDAYCHTPSLNHGYIACGYPEEETKASVFISTLLVLDAFEKHSEIIQTKALQLFRMEQNLYLQEIIERNMVGAMKNITGMNLLDQETILKYLQLSNQKKKYEISLLLLKASQNTAEEEFDL